MLFRFLLPLLLLSELLYAQQADTSLFIRHFTPAEGFPADKIYVYPPVQDKNGYLWVPTEKKLLKYNGYSCKAFTTAQGLPSNEVTWCYYDRDGRLWLFTHGRQFGYIQHDVYHPIKFGRHATQSPNIGGPIVENERYFYFIGRRANNHVLLVIDKKVPDRIYDFSLPEIIICGYNSSGLLTFKKNLLYCRSKFDHFNVNHLLGQLPFPASQIQGLFLGSLKLFFFDNGNIVFPDPGQNALFTVDTKTGILTRKVFEHKEIIYDYALATSNGPLNLITNENFFLWDSSFYTILAEPWKKYLPLVGQVTYFIKDSDTNGWYSTKGQGLWMKYHVPDVFHSFQPEGWTPDMEYLNSDSWGRHYWTNSDRDEVIILNDGKCDVLYHTIYTRNIKTITSVDSQGSIFCSGDWTGFFNHRTGKVSNLLQQLTGRQGYWYLRYSDYKYEIKNKQDRTNYLLGINLVPLSGRSYFGLLGKTPTLIKISDTSVEMLPLSLQYYRHVIGDPYYHWLWLTHIDNVGIFPHKNNIVYAPRLETLRRLGLGRIRELIPDSIGNTFINTGNQLLLLCLRKQVLRPLATHFSLADARIKVCKRHLIAGGPFGLAVAPIKGPGEVGDWVIAPNVNDLKFSQLSDILTEADGTIIVNTDKGLFRTSVDEIMSNTQLLRPLARDLFRLVVLKPLDTVVHNKDTLVLSPSVNSMTLDAINYLGHGSRLFRYKIAGIDAAYQETESGEIFLGDLKADRYYKMTCVVKDDYWNSNPYELYLYRQPLWYQTSSWVRIFWIGGVLLFLLFVGAVILITSYFVRKSNTKKQQLIELELRALYSQINPHFIFNSLNSAQYFINAKDIDKAYDHVSKFAKLLRAYLKSSHDRYITIAEEVAMLHNYIELQQERFKDPFSYSIRIDNKIPAANVQIPSLLLQPLVENAINHGLFHKKERGHLGIEFLQGSNSEEIICIIEDDGVGRERAKEISRANAAARYGSYGTRLTEQLIDIFERYEQMNIRVSYKDKEAPDMGTIVTLTIQNIRYIP